MLIDQYIEQMFRDATETVSSERGFAGAMRTIVLDLLSEAADEITAEMAPGSVEVRLRHGVPSFAVTLPSQGTGDADDTVDIDMSDGESDEQQARISLRLNASLKAQVEQAAKRDGVSTNTWISRALATSLARSPHAKSAQRRSTNYVQGWVQ